MRICGLSLAKKGNGLAPLELTSDMIEEFKSKFPGWDVSELHRIWVGWCTKAEKSPPMRPQATFIRFCFVHTKGRPA